LPPFYCYSANLSINFYWHVCWHAFGDDCGTVTGYAVINKLKRTILWARSKTMSQKLEQLFEKMLGKPSLQQIMPKWMQKYCQWRAFQAALIRTYTTWAAHNWESTGSLFNEHFLTQQTGSLLICYVEEGGSPDPVELAEAWAEQLSWFDEEMRQRHIAQLIPIITNFLSCFEIELRAHPLRSLFSKGHQRSEDDRPRQMVPC
jgi:hypothetical protein